MVKGEVLDTLLMPGDSIANGPTEIFAARGYFGVINAGSELLLYAEDGTLVRRVGAAGGGPGELRMARSAAVFGDRLFVVDQGNSRIQTYSLYDDGVTVIPAPVEALYGPVAFRDSRSLLFGTGGRDTSAVVEVRYDGTGLRRFGTSPADIPSFSLAQMKADIRDGKVPPLMRAVVVPVPSPDGGAALLWYGKGVVQYFDSTGTQIWSVALDTLARSRAILKDFFSRNAAMREPDRIAMLSYFSAGRYREGSLWVLLRSPEDSGTQLLEITRDGRLKTIFDLPVMSVRSFDFSHTGREVLLLDHESGAVVRAQLP